MPFLWAGALDTVLRSVDVRVFEEFILHPRCEPKNDTANREVGKECGDGGKGNACEVHGLLSRRKDEQQNNIRPAR
jgi:hypothetical protein